MGAATIQAANWRFITFGLAGLLFFSTAGNIYLGAQPKAIPHFVEIDKLGQPNYLGPLDRNALRDFTPNTASLHFHLTRFITDTREISSDAAILKRNWLDAYKLVTPDAANELNAYVKEHNPFDELEKQVRVSVQVNAIVPISKETWQVGLDRDDLGRARQPDRLDYVARHLPHPAPPGRHGREARGQSARALHRRIALDTPFNHRRRKDHEPMKRLAHPNTSPLLVPAACLRRSPTAAALRAGQPVKDDTPRSVVLELPRPVPIPPPPATKRGAVPLSVRGAPQRQQEAAPF